MSSSIGDIPGAIGSPEKPIENNFKVHICGRVESGLISDTSQISCGYQVVYGNDWVFQNGQEQGETQLATNQMVDDESPSVSWNFPIECELASTNVSGWPRIAIVVRDRDRNLVGYGSLFVPTSERSTVRYVKLFAPRASSYLGETVASLTSEYPEFYDNKFSTVSIGREAARVASAGAVKVALAIRTEGLEKLGFDNNPRE